MDVTTRKLDRWDGLILAIATMAAGLVVAFVPAPRPSVELAPAPPVPPGFVVTTTPGNSTSFAPSGATVGTVTMTYGPAPPAPISSVPMPVPPMPVPGILVRVTEAVTPYLTAWTVAMLVIRLRRPRAGGRRLTRQPGLAACGAGVLVLAAMPALGLVRWAAEWLWEAIVPSTPAASMYYGTMYGAPSPTPMADLWLTIHSGFVAGSASIGDAIAATWLIMALGGWWRADRHWLDRLGRAIGFAWHLLMTAAFVVW